MAQAPPGQGDQCIFCQLIENPDQLMLVGETENFYAWLEFPEPRAEGQVNVVPKEHVESVLDLPPAEYSEYMTLVREAMVRAKEGIGADGVTTAIHVDQSGGQMMDHAYIQVIPRFEDDENAGTPVSAIFPKDEELQDEELLAEVQEQMQSVDISFGEPVTPHPEAEKQAQKARGESVEKGEEEQQSSGDEESDDKDDYRGGSIEWG
nr:MAG: HIT family hydrolase [Candidatus Nanosalinarum sp. J07AB56]